jgi:Sporulation protein Cse60
MAKTIIQTKLIFRNEQSEFNDAINAFLSNIEQENFVDIKFQQNGSSNFAALISYRTKR